MKIKFLTICIFSYLLPIISAHAGEVVTDGSMGTATNLTGPNYTIAQDLGTTVSNNLFHSFGTFNLSSGDVAMFTGANTIQNVISRVTDGNPSSIDGTIQSQVGNANFFFINPAGMIFGQHAAIDVPAAFHASTANELRFADGSAYNLVTPKGNLTAAPPESFGFLGRTGDIVIEGSQLKFKEGTEVSFTGGSVTSNNATIEVPRGSLRVYGNGDAVSNVPINGELPAGNGVITMNGGKWDVSGDGGGNILISGGTVSVINGAKVSNNNNGSLNATGILHINANTLMQVLNGGQVLSETSASGDAGTINITAGNLTIDGQGSAQNTGIISTAGQNFTGNAGSITINISGETLLLNSGHILTSTGSSNDTGTISLNTGSLTIDRRGSQHLTGVYSAALSSSAGQNIVIHVNGSMQILNGGLISSLTIGSGNAGSIDITAENLIIDGKATSSSTGIGSDVFGNGNAGAVTVKVGEAIYILNGGKIGNQTNAEGNAGSVNISAASLTIDGQGLNGFTGIAAQAAKSTGNAGSITIDVSGAMQILNGGSVSVSTYSEGDAGVITVNAGNLTIDGQGAYIVNDTLGIRGVATGILSSAEFGSTGNAGNIIINVSGAMWVVNGGEVFSSTHSGNGGIVTIDVGGEMRLLNGGKIGSSTFYNGNAGIITVNAGELTIDGQGTTWFTGIESQSGAFTGNAGRIVINVSGALRILNGGAVSTSTEAKGNAGDIIITARNLIIDKQGSKYLTGIASRTDIISTGNAGNITISVNENMQILNGGKVSSSNMGWGGALGKGNAGTVDVSVGGLLFLSGTIETSAGTNDTSVLTGNGGPIHINAPAIVLSNGQITTSAQGQGDGGNIVISGSYLVLDTGFIQANTAGQNAQGGNIFINMDGLLSNGGVTHIGGWKREIFNINSDRNVIQAAANARENYGSITFKNPNDDTASSIGASSNRLEPIKLAKHPCEGIKGRFNFRRRGDVGLPNSGEDIIQFKHTAEIENEAANLSAKLSEQTICAVK